MCRISDEIRQEGFEQGFRESQLAIVRTLARKMGTSLQEALDLLAVPKSEQPKYLAMQ